MGARIQSRSEELLNTLTHGIGAALAVAALVLLVVFASLRGDAWRVTSLSIYGSMLILLYLTSTLYHGFRNPRVKRVFRVLDHSAIFLLIAGTYTPVSLVFMRGAWGFTLFGLIWGMAVGGIVSRLALPARWQRVSLAFYLAMGWLVVVALRPLLESSPGGLALWLMLGGLFYTFGVVFYLLHRLPYHHAIWHLFVLAGSGCHFFGLLFHATALR